jgi:hypothetical protein
MASIVWVNRLAKPNGKGLLGFRGAIDLEGIGKSRSYAGINLHVSLVNPDPTLALCWDPHRPQGQLGRRLRADARR